MTDSEIVNALECCTTNGASCKDCPAFVKVDRSNCKKYFRGALDLITRLQSQNKDLAETIHNLIIEKDALFDKADELKAEVEGQKVLISELIDINNETSDTISKLKDTIDKQVAEIERLKDSITDHEYGSCVSIKNGLIYTHTLDDYENFIEDVSNEACKEFAERVKLEFYYEFEELIPSIMADKIDNLVKEMIGENND